MHKCTYIWKEKYLHLQEWYCYCLSSKSSDTMAHFYDVNIVLIHVSING